MNDLWYSIFNKFNPETVSTKLNMLGDVGTLGSLVPLILEVSGVSTSETFATPNLTCINICEILELSHSAVIV